MKLKPPRYSGGCRLIVPRTGGSNDDGRYGAAWRRLRNEHIAAHPVCQMQTHCDGDVAADVDHIREPKGPLDPLFLDAGNLQSCCRSCHNAKTWKRRKANADVEKRRREAVQRWQRDPQGDP